jgi:hypothetical protein
VRAVSGGVLEAGPGQIASLSFRVASSSSGDVEFIESLSLPKDWQPIIPLGVFTLRPAEVQSRIIAFAIPTSAAAGRYEISYSVRGQSDYGIQDVETVAVTVAPLSKLAIMPEEKPEAVIAGREYHVELRFVNQGNAAAAIGTQVASDRDYPAQLDLKEFTLDAGRDQVVTLSVGTDRNERQMRQHTVEVRALDAQSGKLLAGVAITVNVIPRVSGSPDLYHRLPAQVCLRAMGGGSANGWQTEISGAGSLDEAGTRKVDFLFRGPDAHDDGVFGMRDESRLNYRTGRMELALGDQSYGFSPLTEYYRYGRGTGFGINGRGGLGFGAYYLGSRWELPRETEVGAYVKQSLKDNWLRLNLLRKSRDAGATANAQALDAVLWSLEGCAHPAHHMSLSAEYGRSNYDDAGPVTDDAYRVELEAGARNRYQVSKIHAGPDYQGYYHDCDYTTGAVVVPVGAGTEARASYGRWEQNLDLRPDQTTAPRESLVQFALSRTLLSRWSLSAGYEAFRSRDPIQPATDSSEGALRLAAARTSERSNFSLELHVGRERQTSPDRTHDILRVSALGAYRPSPGACFTLYGSLGGGEVQASRLLGFANNIGATVTLQARDDVQVRFGYMKYGFNSDNQAANSVIDGEVTYGRPDDAAVTLRVLRNSQSLGGRDETSYLLSYTFRFGIPVSRRKSIGAIDGAVYYEANGARTPVADAIVTVDGAGAATGRNGRFSLNSLAPAAYLVRVDRASIGPDQVTKDKCPILVQVKGGETTQLDIALVQGASVTGRVATAAPAANDSASGNAPTHGNAPYIAGEPLSATGPGEGVGLPNVLVELTSGDEVVRRVTDQSGGFQFEALRPGKWRLHVYDYNLPAFHYLEQSEMDLELKAGEHQQVAVRVLPRVRRIRMIEGGNAELSIERR